MPRYKKAEYNPELAARCKAHVAAQRRRDRNIWFTLLGILVSILLLVQFSSCTSPEYLDDATRRYPDSLLIVNTTKYDTTICLTPEAYIPLHQRIYKTITLTRHDTLTIPFDSNIPSTCIIIGYYYKDMYSENYLYY